MLPPDFVKFALSADRSRCGPCSEQWTRNGSMPILDRTGGPPALGTGIIDGFAGI